MTAHNDNEPKPAGQYVHPNLRKMAAADKMLEALQAQERADQLQAEAMGALALAMRLREEAIAMATGSEVPG